MEQPWYFPFEAKSGRDSPYLACRSCINGQTYLDRAIIGNDPLKFDRGLNARSFKRSVHTPESVPSFFDKLDKIAVRGAIDGIEVGRCHVK